MQKSKLLLKIQKSKFSLSFIHYPLSLRDGFTIPELLVYMGIFTILLTVFVQMFGNLIDTQLESSATSSVNTDAKYILARFTNDIRQAQSIASPALGVAGTSLHFMENNTAVIYATNSGALTITNANGTDQLNSSDTSISNLSFTSLGSGSAQSVKIYFVLSSKTIRKGGNVQQETVQTTVGLR